LFGIDLVKSLLIGERLHYVSGESDIPTTLPETKPERNIYLFPAKLHLFFIAGNKVVC